MIERVWRSEAGRLIAAVLVVFGAGLAGCGGDGDGNGNVALTPAEQVEQGWEFFESGDYTRALGEFTAALARDATLSDAQNGAGWSLGRISGRLSEAPEWFARSLQQDTSRYDALGGWAFAVYQLRDYSSAIQKSDSLLRRRPGWRFLHEQTLDQFDVCLMQASSFYYLGDYASSCRVVIDHLNPAFEADVTTAVGRRELLDEIERLRRIYG